ncbi:MAG: protein kinase [Planctomycetes bacterium]|nr:protein kinase [Planctomycetota bacterium]MBI3835078.1 protein kinase [Planctomycetota bacterium]
MTVGIGTKLGPYEIVAPLGAGGMGEVYRARDARLDRDVAIKVLPAHMANDPAALARFEREAKAVAALSHPNILAVYDVGHQDNTAYVVTELLEGETLRQTLLSGAIARRRTLEIAIAISDGLAAAHARGIVHRDLKPENIFLTSDGIVKILDFGLARVETIGSSAQDATHTPTVTLHTSPGTVLGTINYMSPEQIRAQRTDARSDVFSFGCVLFEMLTGEKAFQGETSADTMTAILRESPRSMRSTRRDVSPDLERVIERCLEKKPETRFQSSHDLAFTLRSILADSGSRTFSAAPHRSRSGKLVAGFSAVLILVGGFFLVRHELLKSRHEAIVTIGSLAVLPWENVSRDPEQEYFVDGMTEALISDLAKIGSLKVISRTSVMRYKATTKSLPEIARELNVDAVVEGSVLRVGDRVRISAELIRATTDEHLWSESYDRDLSDVLRLQSEVARTIAQEIKVALTPQEQARMGAARPVNPEAYQAYLKGRFHWNKRNPDGLQKAVEYFEQAIALAPDWPLGYAGLADAYLLMPWYSNMRPSEANPKARTAAARALEMDESLAEAHATMAVLATDYDRDWPTAQREFQRALALSPNYATAHQWYGLQLRFRGRHDEAIREATKAQELDPLSLIISVNVGEMHYYVGDLEKAETQFRKTLEFGPDFAEARIWLANTLFLQARPAEAITEAREAVRLSNNDPHCASTLGYLYAKSGQTQEARKILDEITARSKGAYVAPTYLAVLHAGLEDSDQMFEWLERAYQEHDVRLLDTLIDPLLADMRSDQRLADLVRRLGLPPLPVLRGSDLPASPLNKTGQRGIPDGKIMLAVLPFANDSGDNELDYLSDGIAETLINGFSRLEGLSTVPRSTAFRHKGDSADPVQVGQQLSATAVLTGRVLKRGENLTIQAELTDVGEGRQLWGERYQRKFTDLVEIERDIAGEITNALSLRLNGEEKRKLSRGYSENAEAYRLYLEARFWWSKRTKTGFDNALRLLNLAIQLDPSFALAHSGIADTYSLMPMYGFLTPRDAVEKAQAAAARALQLDDQLAEAHTSMGMVRMYGNWDFERAEKDFKRAFQLNPRYPTGHQWYALCIGARGRLSEARAELRRAIELDPLAPIFTHNLAWVSAWERNWTESLSTAEAGLEFAPEFPWLHQMAGQALLELGRADESLVHLRKAVELAPLASFPHGYLGYALARAGHEQEARELLTKRLELAKTQYMPPSDIAAIYVGLGEFDAAIQWLEKGYEAHDTWMVFLSMLPQFEPLRSDPRFVDILRRVGLPNLRAGHAPTDPSSLRPTP